MRQTLLDYYARPGPLTGIGPHAELVDELPNEIGELCSAIQGLVIHRNWAPAYGVELLEERMRDAQARAVSAILERILALDARPLREPRPPELRFAGTCRDFSVLLCAILRHRGVPARARCGFGTYFLAGAYEDHWICEHWSARDARWVATDAQIDTLQRRALSLDFDPLELPDGRFWIAGRTWEGCRRGEVDPARCGIFDMHGLWFVRANVFRDLAALNRVELLPWDDWGLALTLGQDEGGPDDLRRADRVSALTLDPDAHFDELRALYAEDPDLRVPDRVRNWQTGADEPIPQSDDV